MPILDANCISPLKDKDEIAKDIDNFLKKEKEWNEYKIKTILPVASPFYFCLLAKIDNVEVNEDHIEIKEGSKVENLYLEVNAINGKVSEELYKKTLEKPIVTTRTLPDIYKVENKLIPAEKAVGLATYYAQIKYKKSRISAAGVEFVYWPIWKIWVELKIKGKPKEFLIMYDCVFGKILNKDQIPEREVGWLEVFHSLTGNLTKPNCWFEYGDHAKKAFFKTKEKEVKFEEIVVVLLIILIIILIFS